MKLSKKSWHFFIFASSYMSIEENELQYNYYYNRAIDNLDFCSYSRRIILHMLFIIISLSISSLALFVPIYVFGISIVLYTFMALCIIISILTVVFSIALMIKSVFEKISHHSRKSIYNIDKPDSFMKAMYKKYIDKVCFKIDFMEKNKDV